MKKLILLIALFTSFTTLKAQQSVLSASVKGSGKQPVVLIHGMACSSDVWNDFVEEHEEQYELHLIHFKGFGNKESVNSEHLLKQMRDELIEYVKSNNIKNAFMMGHSMGGFLSLWAATVEKDLFAGIISVDGIPYFPVLQNPSITPESAKPMIAQMQKAQENMAPEMLAQQQRAMIASMIATESKREKVVKMGLNSNRDVINQAYGEMYTTDIRKEVNGIESPVLVFGAWKAYEPYGVTKESVKNAYGAQIETIKNSKLLIASQAYHFVFYDEKEWFNQQVNNFINENS